MPYNRREFLELAAGGMAAGAMAASPMARAATGGKVKAVLFDPFVIFDQDSIEPSLEQILPGNGSALMKNWRSRLFDYFWLRTAANKYENFHKVAEDSLIAIARTYHYDLTEETKKQALQAYFKPQLHGDVPSSLLPLKTAGIKMIFLSHFSKQIFDAMLKNAGVENFFDASISTETIQTYKPDPRAYRLAMETLKLSAGEIVYATSSGWDASGAKWFGYTTFMVNRADTPLEELGPGPDAVGKNLNDMVDWIKFR